MKKITLLVLLVLVAALLTASYPVPVPVPAPVQRLTGILSYSRNNVCMIRDYVSLPVMENVYIVGKGFPTLGQFQGCQITAIGNYIGSNSYCKVFQVTSSTISCPLDPSSGAKPSPTNH